MQCLFPCNEPKHFLQLPLHKNTANAPTATPIIAPAVCIAPPPVLLTLDGALCPVTDPDGVGRFNAPAPPLLFGPSCLIALAPRVTLVLPALVVALAATFTLVAVAPQIQWFIVPWLMLACMFTQNGADEAVHAIAAGSL